MNEYIYENFLLLTKQQKELLNNSIKINELIHSFLQGGLSSEQNKIKMPLISNNQPQGEEIMKFKGKTIHKNKKCNTWYTRYRENGKQYYISGKTQKEVLKQLKLKLNHTTIEIKNKTLIQWFDEWLKLFKINIVKDSTIRDYYKLIKHINKNILNKDINEIKSIEILNNLQEIKLDRTRQKVFELLKALFTKAKQHEITNKNIMETIDKPKYVREVGTALTIKEQEKFINQCNLEKYGDLLLTTLYQGLRIGEVLALTGNDIDIINKKLTINKSINEKQEVDTTKNLQSNRIMPIFDNTIKILSKYTKFKNHRIFDYSYNVPQKHLKDIIKKINIRNISLHDLRHTFITNCKNKKIPEHIIQTWVGHKIGSQVTSKVYTHTNEEDTLLYLKEYNKSL